MNALITGGSGSIGGRIASHLHAKGWSVRCPSHMDMPADQAQPVSWVFGHLKHKLDLVVCAHGIYGEAALLEDSKPDLWRYAIETNLIGTYNVIRYALPVMREGGLIITMAGGGGLGTPLPFLSSYACSKTAIVSLTRTLAEENKAVRVNCIFPGMQDSKIHDSLLSAGPEGNPHYQAIKDMREKGVGAVPAENTLAILDHLLAGKDTGRMLFARTWPKQLAEAS